MSEYNENALYYHEQVVILDTTNAGSTSGGLIVKGGISGKDTYITGHVAVNNVKITPNKNDIIFEQQAILDRTDSFTNITDFYFDDSIANSFKAIINVTVSGGVSKYALWEINGVYKPTGWVITSSFTGDQTGVNFKIVNSTGRGQIQYTNLNVDGTATTVRYRASTTAPPGSTPLGEGSGYINNTSGPYIANRLLYSNSVDTIANTDLVYASNVFTVGGTSRILAQSSSSFTNFSNGGSITSMGDASVAKKVIVGEKIGIVTTSPQFNLDVTGDINFTGNFYKNGALYSGSSIWDTNANNEIYTTQNLGIGTSDPTYKVDVSGGIRVTESITAGSLHVVNELATNISSATLNLSSGLTSGSAKITDFTNTNASIGTLNVTGLTAGNINFTGTLYENGTPYVNSQWTTGTVGNLTYTGGNVGINTTSPQTTLDVSGSAKVLSLTTGNLNVTGTTVLVNVTTANLSASTINSSLVAASIITGGSLSLSGDLFVAGSLTAVNITTTNLMDTNLTAGVAKITDANITTATVATLLNTNAVSTNVSSATLTLSTGLTSVSAQITNQTSTNISSGTLNVSTGLTTASLQATNANVTTATIATLLNTNQNSTNISSATLLLSTGLTSASLQATNANVTTATVATLLNTNVISTNISSATLNLSSGLTTASLQVTNQNSTNVSSATLSLSTGLTSSSAQITNANVTTATVATLLNTNAVSTNISAATLNLSTGLTSASLQVTNENVTTSTIATARITTSLLATGTSNTIGNIFTTGGNVGIGIVNPSLALEVSGRSVMKNAGIGTSGALYLDDSNKGIEYSGNNASVNSYFEGSFPTDGIAVFGFSDGALGTKRGGSKTALAWNSTGNVGIGTTSPGFKLDVNGVITARNYFNAQSTSANVATYYSNDNSVLGWSFGLDTDTSFKIKGGQAGGNQFTNNILSPTRLTISTNGNVGIGTTSPMVPLEVNNIIQARGGGVGGRPYFAVDDGTSAGWSFGMETDNSFRIKGGAAEGNNFRGGATHRLTIAPSGNVGIGTTSPVFTLDVSGTARITTSITTGALFSTDITSTNIVSTNVSSATLNLSTGLTSASAQVTNANISTATIATLLNTNLTAGIARITTNLAAIGNSNTVGAIITTGGNVGIGITSPTFTLDVNGTLEGSNSNGVFLFASSGNVGIGTTVPSQVFGSTMANVRLALLNGSNITGGTSRILIGGDNYHYSMIESAHTDNGYTYLAFGTSTSAGAPTEKMRIDREGNVGIGTTSPSAKLHVITSDATDAGSVSFWDSTYAVFGKSSNTGGAVGIGFNAASGGSLTSLSPSVGWQVMRYRALDHRFIVAGDPTTPPSLTIASSGNVGIGTTAPGFKLDVNGTARITTSITTGALRANGSSSYTLSYGFLNGGGGTGFAASQTNSYSVYAEDRIAATEFNAYSDIRIKKNIIDINDETALITLRQIEPKRYNYIDTLTKTSTPVWGFIAQQVESVLDYSVNKITDYVPNIYSKAGVVQNTGGSILTLQTGNTNVLDSSKSSDGKIKIKIYTSNEELPIIETNVKTIINDTQLQIEENINEFVSEVFVYGQTVNDFNALNKDAIFTVSVAALQEVDRQLQTAKNDISDLQTRLAQLEAIILNN